MKKDKRIEREQGDVNTTANRKKYWERNLSGQAKKWFDEDAKYFLHQSLSTPVLNVLSRTDGIYIEDLEGKQYIDMHGNGVHNAGFNNPAIIKAVKKQLGEGLAFCPRRYTNIPAIKLAKKLAEITPEGLCRSLFCPGGSEAIEMSLMLARQVTGRFKTISFWDSFHGAGFGAASVGGEEHFTGGLGPLVPGAFHVEFPNYYRNPWGFTSEEDVDAECLRQMELILKREPEMAAIIGEPISATPVVPSKRYWEGVKQLCERFGALLIFDEIITGFRLSPGGAQEFYRVTPDITILGKVLGGGFPIGAVTGRMDIMEKMNQLHFERPYFSFQGGTFTANPVSLSAGLEMLKILEDGKIISKLNSKGSKLRSDLCDTFDNAGVCATTSGAGSLFRVHFTREPVLDVKSVQRSDQVKLREYHRFLISNGVFMLPGKSGSISDSHSSEDLQKLVQVTEDYVNKDDNP